MKAALITAERELECTKARPKPACGPHDIRIRIRSCALSDLDLSVHKGIYDPLVPLPAVPGYDIAGEVEAVGSEVKGISVGQAVAVCSALDSEHGGCAELTVQPAIAAVPFEPEEGKVSFDDVAASLSSGLAAYTALYYQLRLLADEFLLFCPPPHGADAIPVQLAAAAGARIIVAAASTEAHNLYSDLGASVVRVVDATSESVVEAILAETAGRGVDAILDMQDYSAETEACLSKEEAAEAEAAGADEVEREIARVELELKAAASAAPSAEDPSPSSLSLSLPASSPVTRGTGVGMERERERGKGRGPYVSKTDLIQCLAVHGRWTTTHPEMQLDPPEARQLFLRGASLSFLFPQAWLLAPTHMGRYQHVMRDLLSRLEKGTIRPTVRKRLPLEKIRQAHRDVAASRVGKVVVVPGI